MKDINLEYDKITKERNEVIDRLQALERHKIIREYNVLKARNLELLEKQKYLDDMNRIKTYENCNHLTVITNHDIQCSTKGCIKCGLRDDVLIHGLCEKKDILMGNYLLEGNNFIKFRKAKTIDVNCDLELAHAIYLKLIERYPSADDYTISKYLINALNNIRNNEVNDDRMKNRALRLDLNKDFSKWS